MHVPRLTTRDYAAVLGAVNGLAEVSSRDEFVATVLREFPGVVRSEVTTLNEVDPAAARVVYESAPETFVFPEGVDRLFAELMHQHPLIRHYSDTGDGSALRISDFMDT